MFTLIGLGVGVAYVYSVVAALAPGIFPPSFRGPSGEVAVYFEAAAVIVTLVLLGQVLELRARSQTGAAIQKLLGLAPKSARRLRDDGTEEDVPLDAVQRRRPASGAAGREGAGRRRRAGGPQHRRRVDGVGRADSRREAAGRPGDRRHPQRHGRRSSCAPRRSAPTRCCPASSRWWPRRSAAAPPSSGSPTSSPGTSCPRSSAVARGDVPRLGVRGTRAAHGARAHQRGGRAHHRVPLRARPRDADVDHGRDRAGARRWACSSRTPRPSRSCAKVDTLVVDKTGTLTEGKPKLVSVVPARGCRRRESSCRLAATLERGSEHPLASAIVRGRRGARRVADRGRAASSRSPGRACAARSRVDASRSATAR